METFKNITERCKDLKISLSELCRRSEVSRQAIEYWKKSEPQTLQIYFRIMNALKELENEQSNKPTWLPNASCRRDKRKL
jgi:transcriptional regulator with XRE-family HTH domain